MKHVFIDTKLRLTSPLSLDLVSKEIIRIMSKIIMNVGDSFVQVARLESQVVRYKSAAETSEKLEGELKLEKRKLQREVSFMWNYYIFCGPIEQLGRF